jgi:hypothetical protein
MTRCAFPMQQPVSFRSHTHAHTNAQRVHTLPKEERPVLYPISILHAALLFTDSVLPICVFFSLCSSVLYSNLPCFRTGHHPRAAGAVFAVPHRRFPASPCAGRAGIRAGDCSGHPLVLRLYAGRREPGVKLTRCEGQCARLR